jgi:hypothetical protein
VLLLLTHRGDEGVEADAAREQECLRDGGGGRRLGAPALHCPLHGALPPRGARLLQGEQ